VPRGCDNFPYGFKGTPSARRAVQPRPDSCSGRWQHAEDCVERPGEYQAVGGRGRGESRRRWRGSLARCL